jgi:hypothetical protein
MTEPVPAWPLGQVVDADLAKLPSLGERIWQRFLAAQTDLLVVVERADAPLAIDPAGVRTPHHGVDEFPSSLAWPELLRLVEAEIEAIWLNEPADVRALRLGLQTGEAGVNGQYFSPWVMVTGLVRSLAIVDLAALARLSHHPGFELAHLQVLVHEMLTVLLGVVGYFGLPQLAAVLTIVDRTVDQIEERAVFIHLVTALQTYVNRYNLWLHQTFPWRLGAEFPKPKLADVRSC